MRANLVWSITFVLLFAACRPAPTVTPPSPPMPTATLAGAPALTPTMAGPFAGNELAAYTFPEVIDPSRNYLFYLHGKIVEDQGIHAVSEEYGKYEYLAILERLQANNFVVISEQRPKNASADPAAHKIQEQANRLLEAGVAPEKITVVGASKGAYIAIIVSDLLKNPGMNYVLLGSCNSDSIRELIQFQISLYGNVLAIYDSADVYAGSCQELFELSEARGLGRHDEIILYIGTGHGILYKPLDDWIAPTVAWARGENFP